MKPQSPKLPKRPYRKPQLMVYGDLTEMTRSAGMMGIMDGAPAGPMKTGI